MMYFLAFFKKISSVLLAMTLILVFSACHDDGRSAQPQNESGDKRGLPKPALSLEHPPAMDKLPASLRPPE